MADARQDENGIYYGSYYGESEYLNQHQMNVNAIYIHNYLRLRGWSVEAICGILGNMQAESTINPGCWQSHNVGNMSGGYGLVQWTPASKYIDWCTADLNNPMSPDEMESNLKRILYEVENNIQWIATNSYDFSFKSFTTSQEMPDYLSWAFAWNYERSWVVLYGSEEEKEALRQKRGGYAIDWYIYLAGGDLPDPDPDIPITTSKKKKFNFLLFNARRRRLNQWTNRRF